jgi:hypothetical protein
MVRRWLAALAALIAAAGLASTAGAGQVERFTIHDEYDFELDDFCDVPGLTVRIAGVLDIRGQIVPHGRDRLGYFLQLGRQTETLSANGTSLTSVANVTEKDMLVTDLGGGWVEVLILATGNAVLYDERGKAIARNPGQTRLVIVFDASGNEVSREVVKGSTGRSDDFCDAAVAALS